MLLENIAIRSSFRSGKQRIFMYWIFIALGFVFATLLLLTTKETTEWWYFACYALTIILFSFAFILMISIIVEMFRSRKLIKEDREKFGHNSNPVKSLTVVIVLTFFGFVFPISWIVAHIWYLFIGATFKNTVEYK